MSTPQDQRKLGQHQGEIASWVERKDRIADLKKRWAFIASRPPDMEGKKRRCDHEVNGLRCAYPRAAGTGHRAPLPLFCRLHLSVDFAEDLALLLQDDPEAISKKFFVGCLRMLVEERSRSRGVEAQTALKRVCDALVESYCMMPQ